MAGTRSHFIPRFLQKGFASRVDGDKVFTWLFRKDTDPRESSTKDVGLESKFSFCGQNTEADDQITADETKFDTLVSDLRNGVESSLSDPLLPQLLTIFEIRTRHFRQRCLFQSGVAIARYKHLILSDIDRFKKLSKQHWPEYLLWLRENHPEYWQYLQQFDLKEQMEIESKILAETQSQPQELIEKACSEVETQMEYWIRSKHLEMLEQPVYENPRTAYFEKLTYTALTTRKPLILGDSIVLFCVDGYLHKPFLGEEDMLDAVYLPLTPNKVLVGARPDFDTVSTDIREAISRCSLEFFISAENSLENRRLQGEIGADAMRFAEIEIEETLSKMLDRL